MRLGIFNRGKASDKIHRGMLCIYISLGKIFCINLWLYFNLKDSFLSQDKKKKKMWMFVRGVSVLDLPGLSFQIPGSTSGQQIYLLIIY